MQVIMLLEFQMCMRKNARGFMVFTLNTRYNTWQRTCIVQLSFLQFSFFVFFSTQFHPVKFPPLQLFLIKSSAKMDLFMNPHTFRVNRLKKMVTTFFYVWQFVYFRYSHHFCYKIVYCTSNDTFNFIIIWYMMCMLMYQGWHHCRTDETDDWIRWWFEWCFLTGNYLWHKTYLILNANKDDENWQKHKHFSYFIIHFIYCCLI